MAGLLLIVAGDRQRSNSPSQMEQAPTIYTFVSESRFRAPAGRNTQRRGKELVPVADKRCRTNDSGYTTLRTWCIHPTVIHKRGQFAFDGRVDEMLDGTSQERPQKGQLAATNP